MICSEAIDKILEAEPAELRGLGDGPLAEHIRSCSHCRGAAGAVLHGERRLGMELASAVAAPDPDWLLDEFEGQARTPGRTLPSRSSVFPRKLGASLKRFGAPFLPIAAAAAFAFLFFGGDPQLPGEPYTPLQSTSGLGLEVPDGQNAVVLATNNPDITVLWFF